MAVLIFKGLVKKIAILLFALSTLSATTSKKGGHFDLFAEALYWHASENVDWAYTLAIAPQSETVAYQSISFGWDGGFKVGIGYHTNDDEWGTQVYYTWFQTEMSAHAKGDVSSTFIGSRAVLYSSYEFAKIKWNLDFNMFDWEVAKTFSVSPALSLSPFIGIKAGWIDQPVKSQWTNPLIRGNRAYLVAQEELKNKFSGGGPKGGLGGKWGLGNVHKCSFHLLADFSASYMWGSWRLKDFFDGGDFAASVKVGNRKFGSIALQGLMGFGFDLLLNHDRSHLTMKVGYEIQDFLQIYQGFDADTGGHNNDLVLQGANISLHFDF